MKLKLNFLFCIHLFLIKESLGDDKVCSDDGLFLLFRKKHQEDQTLLQHNIFLFLPFMSLSAYKIGKSIFCNFKTN